MAMPMTWIAKGKSIIGSVVMMASLSPTDKSTALAEDPKLNEYNYSPVYTFHILAVWSGLPIINIIQSLVETKSK